MRWLVALLLAGCFEDPTVLCGDHRCPAGLLCTTTSCATPEAVAACAGLDEHAACTTSAVTSGACGEGACHVIECGDLFTDPPEACDDGNLAAGDGCSSTCNSDETCGNGVTDIGLGEACDDGTFGRSQDGCSSRCNVELGVWKNISPAAISGRYQAVTAYDSSRGRIVLFGGTDGTQLLSDTWEWDRSHWLRRLTTQAPPGRIGAGLAYDAARKQVVLFGGASELGIVNDTWLWDGLEWTKAAPTNAPPPRENTALAYDAARQRVVMFGGGNGTRLMNDTWEWDGANWVELHPANPPPGRVLHTMAYSVAEQRIVMVSGGEENTGTPMRYRDTWEWDGTTWTPRSIGVGPKVIGAALAYDVAHDRMVLFGGWDSTAQGGTWIWDGNAWAQVTPTQSPAAREKLVMASDGDRPVLFGGRATLVLADMWNWNGSTWSLQLATDLAMPVTYSMEGAFDARHGRAVMQKGTSTWEWVEHRWQPITTGPTSNGQTMVYDSVRDRIVKVGEGGQSSLVWELVDEQWQQLAPLPPPPGDVTAAAFDSVRHETLAFGVQTGTGGSFTWGWDGTTWHDKAPVVTPSPRYQPMVAFDANRGRMVLFGGTAVGISQTEFLDDTWEWDGTSWTQIQTPTIPPARCCGGLTYDPVRQRVVLFGGNTFSAGFNDLWEWDGTSWSRVDGPAAPTPRQNASLVYDAVQRELVVFGGAATLSGAPLNDVWSFRYESRADTTESCLRSVDGDGDGLVGCADPDCAGRCMTCGNGICDPVEDHSICAADCP